MKQLTAVIIEDEEDARSLLTQILKEYCPSVTLLGTADSPETARTLITKEQPDVIFLDIELNGGDGFEMLDGLNEIKSKVIFTTAYDAFALKAYKYKAINYLLKPYSPSDVQESINRIMEMSPDDQISEKLDLLLENKKDYMTSNINIPSTEGITKIAWHEIVHIDADRAYCHVLKHNKERVTISRPLADVQEMLPPAYFMRVHSSHLINKEHVRKYVKAQGGYLIMSNDSMIPVSRRRRELLDDLFS